MAGAGGGEWLEVWLGQARAGGWEGERVGGGDGWMQGGWLGKGRWIGRWAGGGCVENHGKGWWMQDPLGRRVGKGVQTGRWANGSGARASPHKPVNGE